MKSKLPKNAPALILIALSIIFIIAGAYRQEIATVWTKAAAICLECVGIG